MLAHSNRPGVATLTLVAFGIHWPCAVTAGATCSGVARHESPPREPRPETDLPALCSARSRDGQRIYKVWAARTRGDAPAPPSRRREMTKSCLL